uniref:C-type lectin domain-containing protein n=1 Tax=Cyclopterus lumpus TaxID=8103 RepID=A0A8C2WK29_CYCLU
MNVICGIGPFFIGFPGFQTSCLLFTLRLAEDMLITVTCFVSDSHCDAGYLLYGDFCYQFETESVKTWHDAEAHCSREQAHLASLHSEEELSFLTGDPTGISLWMGGHDSVTEGGWEWSNGSPFRYIRWSPGNPDNFNGEDCLSILINNGYWNDDTCQQKRGYICKRKGEICCFNCC